jgi:hypothetical protein
MNHAERPIPTLVVACQVSLAEFLEEHRRARAQFRETSICASFNSARASPWMSLAKGVGWSYYAG